MRVGPSRLPLIDVARQSGQKPYCLISECSRDVECCLTSGLPLPHWSFQAGPQLLFRFSNQSLLMLALWSCGRRASVVQAQRQIHRVLLAAAPRCIGSVARAHLLTAALMPAEPHIRSPFPERLAPQSLILEVIGLGRAGPHCICGISQPMFATVRPPGSNGADQASWNSR